VQSRSRQDDLLDNEDELAQDHAAEKEQQVLQLVAGLDDHLDGGGESPGVEALQLDASLPLRLAALPRRVTELVYKIEIPHTLEILPIPLNAKKKKWLSI